MKTVNVDLGDRSYPIYIEWESLSEIGTRLKNMGWDTPIAVISDQTVSDLYAKTVMLSLHDHGLEAHLIPFPAGEKSKSYTQLQHLHTQLLEKNLKRDSLIIALGGGVTGDLAGFAASTFLRGIPFVQIPTTLLSQVDSSVGGKVGINHPLGKNLVGNFYQPKLVLMDPDTLTTLPEREIWAGMAEVVKYGLIWDRDFFDFLEIHMESLARLKSMEDVEKMLQTCCAIKAEVVRQDEKEGGLRRILNFGHTLAHAIEAVATFGHYLHGEAVVHGMRWAAWVSWQRDMISEEQFQQIESLLKRIPAPPLSDEFTCEDFLDKIRMDKKQTGKGLNLVLLDDIGSTQIVKTTTVENDIEGWLQYVQNS